MFFSGKFERKIEKDFRVNFLEIGQSKIKNLKSRYVFWDLKNPIKRV